MKQPWLASVLVLVSIAAEANVACYGTVERVYAGAHGPNGAGSKFWIELASGTYPLGVVTDDLAKARYAMALSAFAAGNEVVLMFYSHTTCAQALLDGVTPTAMYVNP
jgi:hypothetical protein